MKATYYIGGKEVSREEWDKPLSQWASADIAQHCRTPEALPPILTQDEIEADYAAYKAKREAVTYGDGSGVIWLVIGGAVAVAATVIAFAASASTLEPQYDDTGRPFFAAQGPQCWSGKYHGEPMDCDLIDSIAEPAPFDVARWKDGFFETPRETFARTGAYGYGGDVPAVRLPGAAWMMIGALGMLGIWRKR